MVAFVATRPAVVDGLSGDFLVVARATPGSASSTPGSATSTATSTSGVVVVSTFIGKALEKFGVFQKRRDKLRLCRRELRGKLGNSVSECCDGCTIGGSCRREIGE